MNAYGCVKCQQHHAERDPAVEAAAMARERSDYLKSMADHYADRFHPDISYLLGASNMLGAFADRIEAAIPSSPPPAQGLDELARALHRLNIPTWDYGRMRDVHDPSDQTGCWVIHLEQAEAILKEWSDPSLQDSAAESE